MRRIKSFIVIISFFLIAANVQAADEDLRKDMILTEAGLEVSLPETHALINLEGV